MELKGATCTMEVVRNDVRNVFPQANLHAASPLKVDANAADPLATKRAVETAIVFEAFHVTMHNMEKRQNVHTVQQQQRKSQEG